MKKILVIVFAVFTLGGCGAAQLAIGGASLLLDIVDTSSSASAAAIVPGDTRETIVKKIGEPNFAVNIDGNKEVLYYNRGKDTTVMLAMVDGIYKENFVASTRSVEDYKRRGALKSGAKKIFKSFRDDLTSSSAP
ncbi:hypothetical protein MNBD_NITROSPIRAE03-668 [hydrothermal vent metagenome]|uniref:Lipoprotein SmpA/OmlA domain-containing protein n=1 Tax=hydrothermal vent metagenome TaxID=652676 RepID=A0A3B1DFU3_9ZZZZ